MDSCVYLLRLFLFSYLMIFALCSLQSPESSGLYLSIKANNTGPINLMVILGMHGAKSVHQDNDVAQPSTTCNLTETSQKTEGGISLTSGTAPTELVETLNEIPSVYLEKSGLYISDGYEYKSSSSNYKFHFDFETWNSAKEICESEDAHLAIINSEEERDVLLDIWSKARLTKEYKNFGVDMATIHFRKKYRMEYYIFLGFHDQNEEGKFETILGNTLNSTGFDKWDNNEPNDEYPGEDCGSFHLFSGQFNDIECDAELRFICERESKL